MADDRADPITANYDPEAEEHIFGLTNGDILYVPTDQDEEEISSYLNLDGEDEGRQQDDAEQTSINDDLQLEVPTTSGAEVYIYMGFLVSCPWFVSCTQFSPAS